MVKDGRAAALWGAGIGWPGFTTMAQSGARFIVPSADEDRAHPGQAFVPEAADGAGEQLSRPDRALITPGSWSFILGRANLPAPPTSPIIWRVRCTAWDVTFCESSRRPARRTAADTLAAAPDAAR